MTTTARLALPLLAALAMAALPAPARAHCDTLDGPVVRAARAALETGKPAEVLAWVQPADEAEVRAALAQARTVRGLGPEAKALADRSFLETVVRVHRAGEGAPYQGLQPAGQDLGPAIPAADRAAAGQSAEALERLLVEAVRRGLHERLERLAAQQRPGADVAAGRAWVAAYVPFVHWVEAVHATASAGAAGGEHVHGGAAAPTHPEPPAAAAGGPHAH